MPLTSLHCFLYSNLSESSPDFSHLCSYLRLIRLATLISLLYQGALGRMVIFFSLRGAYLSSN